MAKRRRSDDTAGAGPAGNAANAAKKPKNGDPEPRKQQPAAKEQKLAQKQRGQRQVVAAKESVKQTTKQKAKQTETKEPVKEPAAALAKQPQAKKAAKSDAVPTAPRTPQTIQIIAGSYDRVLHGITASIGPDDTVTFADTFLFSAHTAALRCLAVSAVSAPVPGQAQKVFLASGSSDERINVYNLSAHPPSSGSSKQRAEQAALLSSVSGRRILENPKNRELGTLLHHSSSITALSFPTRAKLLSASEDSTVGVTRTRDWQLLSAIKVPVAKAQGRPSGDTAPLGGTPAGVNAFAVHPSMKVMISVSRGERCMRLWNLATGKRAGVLNFGRGLLREAGEGKHATGEGRAVAWGSTDEEGDEFAVAFDRDVVVFGMDSLPRCRVIGHARTKVHRIRYFAAADSVNLLVVSTEDGRILFLSTERKRLVARRGKKKDDAGDNNNDDDDDNDARNLPTARIVGQVGGRAAGVDGRVKDFVVLKGGEGDEGTVYVVGGSSDGRIRVWRLLLSELLERVAAADAADTASAGTEEEKGGEQQQVGKLLGVYASENRITCVEGFVMIPRPEGVEDSEDEDEEEEEEESSSGDDDEDE